MKAKLLLCSSLFAISLTAQDITFANFSQALTDTIPVNIANNSSFNASLPTTTGYNVTWDASSLSLQVGPPTVHLSYHASATTPQGAQYPASNVSEYDPALTSIVAYNYYGFGTDSLVHWGSYSPNSSHEIYQDSDKRLIFPFSYGQSFTDNYAKTNYSDATTVSSYQTGTRTVNYAGFGTLILPQGYFWDVVLVKEVRTNSLGPDSYNYTWYELSTGKKLLFRSENNGSITTAWCADPASEIGMKENGVEVSSTLFPNPMHSSAKLKIASTTSLDNAVLKLYNAIGEELRNTIVYGNEINIERNGLENGIYFYSLISNGSEITKGKILIQTE